MAQPASPTGGDSYIPPDILQQLQDPSVKKLLAETMLGEAGGEGPRGMQDVLDVAINRARESGQSLSDVLNTKGAFTSMDYGVPGSNRPGLDASSDSDLARAYAVISKPNSAWDLPQTADTFYNPRLQAHMHDIAPGVYKENPSWLAAAGAPVAQVGHQNFYHTGYKGGQVQSPDTSTANANLAGGGLDDATIRKFLPDDAMYQTAKELVKKGVDLTPQVLADIEAKAKFQQETGEKIEALMARGDAITDRYMKATDSIIAGLPDEQKMQQEELRKVSDEPLHPSRVLGQMIPMLAVIGGAFLGAGPAGVLDAAAAAANAARGHDEKAMTQAHLDFQDKLTETLDKASLIHEEMAQAITNNKDDVAGLQTASGLIAAKYGITALEQAAYQDSAKTIFDWFGVGTKTIGELDALRTKSLQQQLEMLKVQQAAQGGKPQLVNDANGKTVMFWPGRTPDQGGQWTDTSGKPVAAPDTVTHIQSGRLYGGVSGALQAAAQDKQRAGGGPLTEQDVLGVVAQYEVAATGARQFGGPLGSQVRAFNVGIAHLDTLAALGDALQNGDLIAINALKQEVARQTGSEVPTDFDAVKRIVGQEVNKAIVAGGGGERERDEAAAVFSRANSPEQLSGAISQVENLMASQLGGLRQQYESTTHLKDFDTYLSPRSEEILGQEGIADPQTAGQGFKSEEDHAAFQHDVFQVIQFAQKNPGKITVKKIEAQLKQEYPDATDDEINAAVAAAKKAGATG